ncbi:hypothetical protein SIL73_13065 [Acidithiobacillus thiooxidans]|uniref:hypothetical protein n=1 Tax=Acidithiobacillus thiooxidans TaxID=930 RepID=UPI0029C1A990|nr:hypothetical protein [Acidithiobacillus thiooxidans]MDX5935620.1 hypothetical protein [Acidithiobacillus thiooxidans]
MTLSKMADKLRIANPENKPMTLQWMAEQWWSGERWLTARAHEHNGGAKVGGRVAGGFAGRLCKAGLLRECRGRGTGKRSYQLINPPGHG